MKIEIKKMHIENDVVNKEPKIIFTDENGVECRLTKKSECWYFKKK